MIDNINTIITVMRDDDDDDYLISSMQKICRLLLLSINNSSVSHMCLSVISNKSLRNCISLSLGNVLCDKEVLANS